MKRHVILCVATVGCLIPSIGTTMSPAFASEMSLEQMRIHQAVTQSVGTFTIGRFCPVVPRRDGMYPIYFAGPEAYSGNPLYLQGSCPPVLLAGCLGKGRIVACGQDNWLLEQTRDPSVSRLSLNCLQWLAGPARPARIAFYTSMGKLVTTKTLSTNILRELSEGEITVGNLAEPVSPEKLNRYAVLVIARPHARRMDQHEADVICEYVKNGGGVFLAGLGWYWAQGNSASPMTEFPLNVLGHRLGVEFVDGLVWQQTDQGHRGPVTFRRDTPKPWHPRPTKVFQCAKTTDKAVHAFVRKHMKSHNFAIEGEHAILTLPAYAFLQLRSPTKASQGLDRVYETHKRLASSVPYQGKKISIIVVDKLNCHLSSGNPIIIRPDRVPVVLNDFNDLGHPGWGLTHEFGHDSVESHEQAYQLGWGDNECWADVFTTHAYETLGLKYDKNDMHWNEQKRGISYYFANKPDYKRLKADDWIVLSLLTVIKETYGWDAFNRFFQECANRVKAGSVPRTVQKKVDFLVYELSKAAGADLSGHFIRWGFPVSESVTRKLQTLPKAQLDKAAKSIAARLNVRTN